MKVKLTASLAKILQHATVEPSFFLLNISIIISNFLFTNLYLQKSCRPFNATVGEPDLSTPCDDERTGQQYTTKVNSWRHLIGMVLSLVFTTFASSWSEKSGKHRRPLFLFIPQLGQMLVATVGCLSSYFWHWPIVSSVVLETFASGLTGARFMMNFAAEMYIRDMTTKENRPSRLGVLALVHILALIIGNGVVGFLARRLGFFVSFCIDCAIIFLGILLGIILIEDKSISVENNVSFQKTIERTSKFEIFSKKRRGVMRYIIWILLFIDTTSLFLFVGNEHGIFSPLLAAFVRAESNFNIAP